MKIGYSRYWDDPIHVTLKKLKVKYNLKWLHFKMSYHRYPNIREALHADLMGKISKDIVSRDEKSRACQCTDALRISAGGAKCIFGSRCREKCVVYKASCLLCEKFYLGKTSQFVKERFQSHCNDVQKLANHKVDGTTPPPPSSSLSRHLVSHLSTIYDLSSTTIWAAEARRILRVDVVWKGNPIGCSKNFRSVHCRLCVKERMFIFKNMFKSPNLVLNSNLGIHRDCNCVKQKRFHHLERKSLSSSSNSTDEGLVPERDG